MYRNREQLSPSRSLSIYLTLLSRFRWYMMTFGVNFAGAAILLTFYPQLQLPVWGLFLSVMLAVLFLVPIGVRTALNVSQSPGLAHIETPSHPQVIAAITNTVIGLNVITEFIAGYVWPGRPLANVAFKCVRTCILSLFFLLNYGFLNEVGRSQAQQETTI